MSKISQRGATSPFDPFRNISTGVPNQGASAIPPSGAQPSSFSGFFDPSLAALVGAKFDTSDGRELVLISSGATALVAGTLLQSSAEVTAFEGLAMTVPASYPATAGLLQILVTNGSTVLKVNQFQGGYALVASGTGIGQMFKISSHQAAAASATFVVNLEDPIQTTLDATSKITLQANPYANVVIAPTTATAGPIGVCLNIVAASTAATYNATTGALTANGTQQYGWAICHGPASCLIDNTVTNVGYPLGASKTTAGTLGVATLTTVPQVGVSMQTLTSAQNGLVYLYL